MEHMPDITSTVIVSCALTLAPVCLLGSRGQIQFSNATGRTVIVFTTYGTAVGKFALRTGETHTITGNVNWGWRYDPAEGNGPDPNAKTPCMASADDNRILRISIEE